MAEKRYAVTMWEFSWLVRRTGAEAEYADWDKVLDELAERGYNAIRIDAFPHLIAAGPDGKVIERFTMLPQPDSFMWGSHEAVEVEPRAALIEFINKAKARNIYIGLSCWYNDDTLHRRLMVNSPADYARIWGETLDLLNAEGLLDRILWVDICNEFPLSIWAPGPAKDIFGAMPEDWAQVTAILMDDWPDSARRNMERYFNDSINPLRAKYPQLRYTFSFTSIGQHNIPTLDVSAFGMAEPHIWVTDDVQWSQETLHVEAMSSAEGVRKHAAKMLEIYPARKPDAVAILNRQTDFWAGWAKANDLPLYTTEAWASVIYEDVPGIPGAKAWEWFKDICAEGVRMAVDKGWEGICTSNFCQPHFEGMWADVAWHKKMTRIIRG